MPASADTTLILAKLMTDAGLIDTLKDHRARLLTGHIADWHGVLIAQGRTAKHARTHKNHVLGVFEACGFKRWAEIVKSAFQGHIGKLRDGGVSTRTRNHVAQATKQFTRWMVDNERAASDPLCGVSWSNRKIITASAEL